MFEAISLITIINGGVWMFVSSPFIFFLAYFLGNPSDTYRIALAAFLCIIVFLIINIAIFKYSKPSKSSEMEKAKSHQLE
jgi:mannitol-specific phosphotransferase system IIBC component